MYRETVIVFLITAAWDVILRWMAEGYITLFGVERMKWVRVLKPYFAAHSLLAAALIAGFVGAVTYPIITRFNPSPDSRAVTSLWILLVSGAIGQMMRYSGLFPHLKRHYYDELGFAYSFLTDAFSGAVVAVTYNALPLRKG
jgi:hypothetical protein